MLKGLQSHDETAARMLLFYSFTMTSGGAVLAVASVAQRKRLQASPELLRVCGGRSLAPALCQVLVILEGTLGWVAGCAWTDYTVAKWPSINAFPTLWVLAEDVMYALALSALAVVWLTLTNQGLSMHAQTEESRDVRERYFFTCALSFFCGWSWIAVVRDAWALPTPYLRHSGLARPVGAPPRSSNSRRAAPSRIGYVPNSFRARRPVRQRSRSRSRGARSSPGSCSTSRTP